MLSYEEDEGDGHLHGDGLRGLTAIAPERGLPDDFAMRSSWFHTSTSGEGLEERTPLDQPVERSDVFMGWVESQTWLTGEEMLAWAANAFDAYVLNRTEHEGWHWYITDPETYRDATEHDIVKQVQGDGIVLVDEDDLEALQREDWTHVRCRFRRELREEFAYFFDEVARLVVLHGRIRLVFGFDY